MGEYILRTIDVCKKYGGRYALEHVNMEIKKGQIYGFIGLNGAGKTTLFRAVCGLTPVSSGSIELFGEYGQKGLDAARSRLGSMVETPGLYPGMTAEQNLEVQRLLTGTPGRGCIKDVLQLVSLTDTGKKKVRNFSLGMKQRLGLALALISSPEFLVLDEPVNGLDPAGIAGIRELLKRLSEERGITILISSHILSELSQLATCYGIIHKGKLLKQLTAGELEQESTQCLRIAVGDPSAAAVVIEKELGGVRFDVLPDNIIKLYGFLDRSREVNERLFRAGVPVDSITRSGQDLESYFMNLTKGAEYNA